MPRRSRETNGEVLIKVAALLPWWLCVVLAAVSYFSLHAIASRPLGTPDQHPVGGFMFASVFQGLAAAGQYILPIVFVAGAALSAWNRRARTRLIENVAASPAADALDAMTWSEFEALVGEAFRLQGYRVVETGGGRGPDGGVDLVLSRPSSSGAEKTLVQCKQWRALKVGVDVVRQLYGVMAARGAAAGIVVTSGRYTDEAIRFADGRNLRLIAGPELHQMIRAARSQVRPETVAATHATPPSVPGCPACSRPMVSRTASRGANAGSQFWGCPGFPQCRGTRPLSEPKA